MSYSSFSDNDDDLFDETITSSQNFSSNSSTNDEINSLIKSIDIDDISQIDQMFKRSKIALALYNGSSSFIFSTDSYNKTIFNTLNYLTNNQFQYHLYADLLEESIAKRIVLLRFSKDIVEETSENSLKKIKEFLEVEIDSNFITTYFTSFSKVMTFVIDHNINIYTQLCQEIGREPISQIVEKDFSNVLSTIVSSDNYINNIFNNISSNYTPNLFKNSQ